MRLRSLTLLTVAASLAAFACKAVASPAAPDSSSCCAEYLDRFDVMFGTTGALPDVTGASRTEQAEAMKAFARERMKQPSFYRALFPRLFEIAELGRAPSETGLRALDCTKDKTGTYYSLNGPCAPVDRTQVRPWWDPSKPVSICTRDYHPEVKSVAVKGAVLSCDFTSPLNQDACTCGEALINCTDGDQQRALLKEAVDEEAVQTFAYVIQHKLPYSSLVTMNETVRNGAGDNFYARSRYYRDGKVDVPKPIAGEAPTLRRRDPEFDGGILTTPFYRYFEQPRVELSMVYSDFLCLPFISTAVHSKDIFSLGDARLRSMGHFGLTEKTGCKDCHARLENAVRAFQGFVEQHHGFHYDHTLEHQGTIGFYGRNAADKRGEGPATPRYFGQMIARQPEFIDCAVHKAEALFYGDFPVSEVAHRTFVEEFGKTQDFGALVEDVFSEWSTGYLDGR